MSGKALAAGILQEEPAASALPLTSQKNQRFIGFPCESGAGQLATLPLPLPLASKIEEATIVSAHTGEISGCVTLAMKHRIEVGECASVVQLYPT